MTSDARYCYLLLVMMALWFQFPSFGFANISSSIAFVLADVADFFAWRFPFRRPGFVDSYCLNLGLPWNILFSPSMVLKALLVIVL